MKKLNKNKNKKIKIIAIKLYDVFFLNLEIFKH